MWQQIDANNPAQLQQAVTVLAALDDTWTSANQLKEWIEARIAQVFYYQDPICELVVAFEYLASTEEWRVATGGARGTLGPGAGVEMTEQIVQFTKAQGQPSIAMYTRDRAPGDPIRVLIDGTADVMRLRPDVAEVRSAPARIGRRYEVILR
jgi:hypothetical protein